MGTAQTRDDDSEQQRAVIGQGLADAGPRRGLATDAGPDQPAPAGRDRTPAGQDQAPAGRDRTATARDRAAVAGRGQTVADAPRGRRGNTRRRIQEIALELFAEHGYDKTSLREIAEQLRVTKAALYYHFKTKEDILLSLFSDLMHPMEELIAWGQTQPRTLETKRELLRRYSEALTNAASLFRFMQENEAAMRDLSIGGVFKDRMVAILALLQDPDAPLTAQIRCTTALFTMHSAMFGFQKIDATREEKRLAALDVATDLVTQAHMATSP